MNLKKKKKNVDGNKSKTIAQEKKRRRPILIQDKTTQLASRGKC